jgi:hypothetical protein
VPTTRAPDPLDDARYHYPTTLVGHPPPPAHPGRRDILTPDGRRPLYRYPHRAPSPLRRAFATWGLTVVSLVDAWVFVWSVSRGPAWLVPVAVVGLAATGAHLAILLRRLRAARRPGAAALTPSHLVPVTGSRRNSSGHRRFARPPAPGRRRLRGLRRPGAGSFPLTTSTAVVVAVSLVAAFVLHVAVAAQSATP